MKTLLAPLFATLIFMGGAHLFAQDTQQALETPAAEPAAKRAVKVTLLKPGAEPRKTLRYQFSAEKKQYLSVKMKMSMVMNLGGQALPPQNLPGIIQTIEIQPTSVKNGIMNYRYTLTKMDLEAGAGMNPMMIASMKAATKGIVGLTGTARVDDRGVSEGSDIEFPEGADAMMIQQIKGFNDTMSRMSSPLPVEPVGVGAVWKVDMPIAMNGVEMTGDYTYTLVAIEGNTVKTTLTTTMGAKDQVINDPNLPAGAKVTINSIDGGGDGTVNFDLLSMCPVSKVDAKINQDATISMAGQPEQKMGMVIDMTMDVKPGKPPEEEGAEQPADAAAE